MRSSGFLHLFLLTLTIPYTQAENAFPAEDPLVMSAFRTVVITDDEAITAKSVADSEAERRRILASDRDRRAKVVAVFARGITPADLRSIVDATQSSVAYVEIKARGGNEDEPIWTIGLSPFDFGNPMLCESEIAAVKAMPESERPGWTRGEEEFDVDRHLCGIDKRLNQVLLQKKESFRKTAVELTKHGSLEEAADWQFLANQELLIYRVDVSGGIDDLARLLEHDQILYTAIAVK